MYYTLHPGFNVVCLNHWVLETAWLQYKQQYNSTYDGPENKLNRHTAYRQLARWCWGILGKEIRVVLPACGVCCIRAHFPPPGDEEQFSFEGYHFSDEWNQITIFLSGGQNVSVRSSISTGYGLCTFVEL